MVNNAAEQYDWRDVTQISDEQLQRTFATNIFSHFYMARAALPHLGEGDVIIATSSVNAFKGNDTLIDYSATKGARSRAWCARWPRIWSIAASG